MRLTRTAPQQAVPDEEQTGAWPAGRRDGYTGQFETAPFEPDVFGTGRSDAAAFDGARGGADENQDAYDDRGGRRHSHRASRHRYDDVDAAEDIDDYGHRGRRRWPIVTGSLALLVVLIAGGAYGAWWYNQQQYYVGVHDGYVSIFRGTNQSVAGFGLSSLLTPSTLKVSQLGVSDQATISQTISKGSVADAKALINELQTGTDKCQGEWMALATWQARNVTYQSELASAAAAKHSKTKTKTKVPAPVNPGPAPAAPDAATCAPASAFGIPASALPGTQDVAPATTHATPPTKAASPKSTASVKKSATPTATA
jgi:hypothetical protein